MELEGEAGIAFRITHTTPQVEEAAQLLRAARGSHTRLGGKGCSALPERTRLSTAQGSLLVGAQAKGLLDPVGERVALKTGPIECSW